MFKIMDNLTKQEKIDLIKQLESEIDQLDVMQMTYKVLINSLYGALDNKHFIIANRKIAESVTASGRYFIKQTANMIEQFLQKYKPSDSPYVVYGDTDSVYISLENIVDSLQEAKDFIPIIEKVIEKSANRMAHHFNSFNPSIKMSREIIASFAKFIAKKKYFAVVVDNEGVDYSNTTKIKTMGIEIAQSGTAKFTKDNLGEKCILPVLNGIPEHEIAEQLFKQYSERTDLENLTSIKTVNNLKYNLNDKGVPIGSRAALVHNEYVAKHKPHIKQLTSGERYNLCYLKVPNKFKSNVISYESDEMIDEIVKSGAFDYKTNFEKYVLSPFNNMFDCDVVIGVPKIDW